MTDAGFYSGLLLAVVFILNYMVYRSKLEKVKTITKPLVMISIILWTAVTLEKQIELEAVLLLSAQSFGFLGDVSLLFPKKGFIFGLTAFLFGHLFYIGLIVMLMIGASPTWDIRWYHWVFLGMGPFAWILGTVVFLRVFTPALDKRGASRAFLIALKGYAFVLSGLMGVSIALLWFMPGFVMTWLFVAVGGTLFFLADFLLAYNRFVGKNDRVHLVSWLCYHTAQISLAWGLVGVINQVVGS